jgi:hypothetical protein
VRGRHGAERKLSLTLLLVVMVAVPLGIPIPVRAPLRVIMDLQHEVLRVKTVSFLDVRRQRHWRRALFGGAPHWRPVSIKGSGCGQLVVLPVFSS